MISEKQNLVVVGAGIAGLATAYFYKRLSRFQDDQIVIPTHPVVRQASLQLGTKAGSLSTLRSMRNMINRMSIAAARASELVNWRSRPAV
jgi:glycine/D-amino acid oxidase-like deaminating enzyme